MRLYYSQLLIEAGLPGWLVPDYSFMLSASIILGSVWMLYLWTGAGQDFGAGVDLVFWAVPGLFLGAKLLYALQFGFPRTLSGWWDSGIALYGGFFGIVIPWLVLYWIRPYPVLLVLDCLTPGLALGLFLVRIGCFLHGCNGGLVCDLPWATQFPRGTAAYSAQVHSGLITGTEAFGLPSHPTQLYESLFGLLCIPLLYAVYRFSRVRGQTLFVGMLAYTLYRFSTELIRSDTLGVHPLGFTFAQFISLLIATGCVVGLVVLRYRRVTVLRTGV